MCRASKCSDPPTRSPVCIYCGKTNHRSVICRYQPWDNHEESRTTLDTLRTGTNGKNWALAPRNEAGSAPLALIIKFLSVSMVDSRDNPTEVNPVHNPEVNRVLIKVFLTGDNNTHTSMKNTTGDTLPLLFHLLLSITLSLVMLLAGQSSS